MNRRIAIFAEADVHNDTMMGLSLVLFWIPTTGIGLGFRGRRWGRFFWRLLNGSGVSTLHGRFMFTTSGQRERRQEQPANRFVSAFLGVAWLAPCVFGVGFAGHAARHASALFEPWPVPLGRFQERAVPFARVTGLPSPGASSFRIAISMSFFMSRTVVWVSFSSSRSSRFSSAWRSRRSP